MTLGQHLRCNLAHHPLKEGTHALQFKPLQIRPENNPVNTIYQTKCQWEKYS